MNVDPQVSLAVPLSIINYMLGVLGQRPYAEVAGLMREITDQVTPQVNPSLDLPPITSSADEADQPA
jgi:hypothetical protein